MRADYSTEGVPAAFLSAQKLLVLEEDGIEEVTTATRCRESQAAAAAPGRARSCAPGTRQMPADVVVIELD